MRTRAISLDQAVAFMSSFNENNGSNLPMKNIFPEPAIWGERKKAKSKWMDRVGINGNLTEPSPPIYNIRNRL